MPYQQGDIEVGPAVLAPDGEGAYESSEPAGSGTSLRSSISEFIVENGRYYHTYFGAEKNVMPTDKTEQERLDMHHEIFLLLLDGELHKAPVKDPLHILDVGTGTGIWAIDMAEAHPMAEVIGMDLRGSPIQPRGFLRNCTFEISDAETEWTFLPDSFDFIHVRNLCQSISDWPKFMAEAFRCTAPGGYVELAEIGGETFSDDNTMAADNAFKRAVDLVNKSAMRKLGRPAATEENLTARLQDAGFTDIQAFRYKHPFGPWPKDEKMKQIGAMVLLNMETGIEAYMMAAATRVLGMDPAEVTQLCQDAWAALKNKHTHMYHFYYVVYGRKPVRQEQKVELVVRERM